MSAVKITICTNGDEYYSDESKSVTHYDSLNNILSTKSYDWNGVRYVESTSSSAYSYDTLGRLINYESSYNGIDYAYDSLNNIIEKINYSISGGTRQNSTRNLDSYSSQLKIQSIKQNWVGGLWVNNSQTDYHYNQNNLLDSLQLNYSWDGSSWQMLNRTTFFYHPNEKLDTKLFYTWRSLDSTWNISGLDTLTYDSNWLLSEYLTYTYTDTIRNASNRILYTYDSNGYQASYSQEEWDGQFWTPIFWGHSTRDSAGKTLYSFSSCYGCGTGESTYSYDSYGRLSHYNSYSVSHGGIENNSDCDVYYYEIIAPEVVCEGSSITLSADSGFQAYSWSTGESTRSINITLSGTYTLSLLDSNGIWNDAAPARIIVAYGAVTSHAPDSTVTLCRNQNFQIKSPVNPAYSYQWIFNEDSLCYTPSISGNLYLNINSNLASSGCYRLVVNSGCDTDTSGRTCFEYSPDLISSISVTGGRTDQYGRLFMCAGDTILLTASIGASYEWYQTGDTNRSIEITSGGTYYVDVYDSSSCYSRASVSISQTNSNLQPILIAGDSTIALTPGFSWSGYSITWLFNGDTISNFHEDTLLHPSSGYYQAIVSYWYNCTIIGISNVLFYHQDSLLVRIPNDLEACYANSQIRSIGYNLNILHGTAPYTYNWSPSIGLSNPNVAVPNVNIDSLIPDQTQVYVLTVTDFTGKSGSDSVFVTVHNKPTAPVATKLNDDTICNYSEYNKIEFQPKPGQVGNSYRINRLVGGCYSNMNGDFAYLQCGGTYSFQYTENGCLSSPSIPLVVNSYPDPTPLVVTPVGNTTFCYGDSILFQARPDSFAFYQWEEEDYGFLSNSDTADIYLFFGETWRVVATDSNGCKSYSSWKYLTIDTLFHISAAYQAPSVVCSGDSVILWVSASSYPAHTFQWLKDGIAIPNENDSIIYAKETGNYSMKLYPPGNPCAGSSQSILVQFRQLPTVNIVQNTNQLEAVTPAWNFQWYEDGNILLNDTNRFININNNGFYKVVVTDYHGCSASDQFLINCGASLLLENNSCHGQCEGSVLATASGLPPFSYQWSTGDTIEQIGNLCQGIYTLVISDTLGCSDTLNLTITEPAVLSTGLQIDSSSCSDDCSVVYSFVNGGTPPYAYLWCDGSTTINLNACHNQQCQLYIVDFNGCIDSSTLFDIQIPDSMQILSVATGTSCIGCNNGSALVQVTGGTAPYSLSWLPNIGYLDADTIKNLATGNYNIVVQDDNLCEYSFSIFIEEDPTSLDEYSLIQEVVLYPNPVHEKLFIHSKAPNRLILINSLGKIIYQKNLIKGLSELDMSTFASGIYTIRIQSDSNFQTQKLVVQ